MLAKSAWTVWTSMLASRISKPAPWRNHEYNLKRIGLYRMKAAIRRARWEGMFSLHGFKLVGDCFFVYAKGMRRIAQKDSLYHSESEFNFLTAIRQVRDNRLCVWVYRPKIQFLKGGFRRDPVNSIGQGNKGMRGLSGRQVAAPMLGRKPVIETVSRKHIPRQQCARDAPHSGRHIHQRVRQHRRAQQ